MKFKTTMKVDDETYAYLEMYKKELGLASFNDVIRYLIGYYFMEKAKEGGT